VHELQIGSELLEAGDTTYCYIADGGESLQIDYLAKLLSRYDAAGEAPPPVSRLRSPKQNFSSGLAPPLAGHLLRVTALDLSTLHGKMAKAHLKAFKESLKPDRPDVQG